ncbi:hypothetical protein ACFS5N_00575 [Mucilaginibacter ximonensis]|uniref:PKD domain-containing protein n=1 Tax=Mucilaginibacter ximonensis TaxID=538021 RepID=A0ABW5Y6L6_9SPHI
MKNLKLILLGALLSTFIIQGCDKTHLQDIGNGSKLKVSKTQVAVGEPDSVMLTGVTSTDSVMWKFTPDANLHFGYKNNAGVIVFSAPGKYTITAQVKGGLPYSVTITVVAGSTSGSAADSTLTKTNIMTATTDSADFEPIVGDIKVHFSAGYATTDFNTYTANGDVGATTTCPTGIVQYTATVDTADNYLLNVVNIRKHTNCGGPGSVTQDTWASQVFPHKLIRLGTHQLKVKVNGVVYAGSFTVTDKSVTINWPYTSGVIMESQLYYEYR